MLVAIKHFGGVGVGVTIPQLFRADDQKFYVVKLKNNRLGSKVLVNEFIAAKIGIAMGLCFPASDIIEISKNMLEKSPRLMSLGAAPGRHFASRFLNHTKYVKRENLYKTMNINEMAGVILFDHIFHNADRTNNRKNLLLRKEGTEYKIYAIDNSHLFRSSRWEKEDIDNLSMRIKVYYLYSYGVLLRDCLCPEDFIPYVEKIKKISNEYINDIVKEIPAEWLLQEAERQALIKYIILRRDMVEDIYKKICKFIPQAGGSILYSRHTTSRLARKNKIRF